MTVTAEWVADLISADSLGSPRSRRVMPGPSQLGNPCTRHLGYLALRAQAGPDQPRRRTGDPMAAWIGTAVHATLAQILAVQDGWQAEVPVEAEIAPGMVLAGTVDGWHPQSGTVLDWKVTGHRTIDRARATQPTDLYITQAHLYGLLLHLTGHTPRTVTIVYLPRDGTLSGIHVWTAPYSPEAALTTVNRWETVTRLIDLLGPKVLPDMPAADGPCRWCDWHNTSLTVPSAAGCPGPTRPLT